MSDTERVRRWRLVLGSEAAADLETDLSPLDRGIDQALEALYGERRKGGLGASSPDVVRWLDDIRKYFPRPVVKILQADALERLSLRRMLLEPELLASVEPDVRLVSTLVALAGALPARTRETARQVVRRVADDLLSRLRNPLEQAVRGALARVARTHRPRPTDLDLGRTIRANLKNWQPDRKALVVDRLVGNIRRRGALRDVILCVDQSGSMASSVVHSAILGSVLASLPSLSTRMVLFDTSVVDVTGALADPVELLFGARLGGGTDIARALGYVEGLVTRPADTLVVLISDLCEGGNRSELLSRAGRLIDSGVRLVACLALADDGAPAHDEGLAGSFAALGAPAFSCAPDQFPPLMAALLAGEPLLALLEREGICPVRAGPEVSQGR